VKKIKKMFIANRGEIARRIAAGAKSLGIKTVAISGRKNTLHFLAEWIDEFITVENESSAMYLNPDKMIALAADSGCDSIHPGFGFLSENAEFAQKVHDAGMTWIGPSPEVINSMANKAEARNVAMAAEVPCVPGLEGISLEKDQADMPKVLDFAKNTGYPLLIKAAFGGGGKGMRIVESADQLSEAASRASSEALNSFGNGSIIIEKYLPKSRHVEVQVLGDLAGNVVALGDRDCSAQRRHQKVLEEAPAPHLTPATRQSMQQAAVMLAKKVGYSSAGTVEFLVDWSPENQKKSNQSFYFLEMNTRLQVEHPVTEEVFGIDLVAWQLKVAMGADLPAHFSDLKPTGHSIEARLYAEDPDRDFFPAPGMVHGFVPWYGPGIRWEIGLDTIDEISSSFDPMIAKVIATGESRDQALYRLDEVLKRTIFSGPPCNREFLRSVITHSKFINEAITTSFLSDAKESLAQTSENERKKREPQGQRLAQVIHNQAMGDNTDISAPNAEDLTKYIFSIKPKESIIKDISVTYNHSHSCEHKEQTRSQILRGLHHHQGEAKTVAWVTTTTPNMNKTWLSYDGYEFIKETKNESLKQFSEDHSHTNEIIAPVPGKVIKIFANSGKDVKKGQTLLVLESMKMEFEVQATKAGIIKQVHVTSGDQVDAEDLLASWKT